MASMTFRRATKTQSRLRLAIDGPSGCGKTFTALIIAFVLAGDEGQVAVIDTERGSASKYADQFPAFDTLELESYSPQTYTEAIKMAGEMGYDVLIVDSLSHAWEGEGGALDQVDRIAARGGGSSFTAWKDVTPMHRRMVDALLQSPCHVIATMRSKMEYVLEADAKGRMVPRKVGMAPIQRQGTEYEFDIVADMDINHKLVVSKTRCPAVDGLEEIKPGPRWFGPVKAWLEDGAPAPTFLDDERNTAGVREYLTRHEVPPETQDKLIGQWRSDKLNREQILAKAKAAIEELESQPAAAPEEAQPEPQPEDPPPAAEPDPTSERAPAPSRHREGEPEWTGEIRKMFIDAGLPVGVRDAFVAYHVEMGSSKSEATTAYRKALRGMKHDPAEQQDYYNSLLREVKEASSTPLAEQVPSVAESDEVPF